MAIVQLDVIEYVTFYSTNSDELQWQRLYVLYFRR